MTVIPAGTRVVCAQGHHICTTAQDLWPGGSADKAVNLTDWQIPAPADLWGEMPPCPSCGSAWYRRNIQYLRASDGKPAYAEYVRTERGWFPALPVEIADGQ